MDLNKEFKDLNIPDDVEKQADEVTNNLPENVEDFDEGDKVLKELQEKLDKIKAEEGETPVEEVEEEDEEELTFYEKVQPFILPMCLTFFALVFAAIFLYFFSQSRIEKTPPAIVNSGNVEPVYYPPPPTQIIVQEEPLKCEPPQYLNDTGDACLDPEPEPAEVVVPQFEDGTTTIAHVRFSFDKYNYDNAPRGIYMLEEQIFEGDYKDYKIRATNRAFANDHFFGIDRYTVSLIGSCSYVVDDAKILVKNMIKGNNYFTGNVVKIVTATKPRVVCSAGQKREETSVDQASDEAPIEAYAE